MENHSKGIVSFPCQGNILGEQKQEQEQEQEQEQGQGQEQEQEQEPAVEPIGLVVLKEELLSINTTAHPGYLRLAYCGKGSLYNSPG